MIRQTRLARLIVVFYLIAGGGFHIHAQERFFPEDPQSFALIERGSWPDFKGGHPTDVEVMGHFAYVTFNRGLTIIDIADPAKLQRVGVSDFGENTYANRVTIAGNHAYVAAGMAGLKIVDIANPADPRVVGGFSPNSNFRPGVTDVAIAGNYAYVLWSGGVSIIDIRDPAAPKAIALHPLDSSTYEIAISGNYAYVAAGGLHVIDITTPAAPQLATRVNIAAHGIAVSGEHASVVQNQQAVKIFALTVPASPQLVGEIPVAVSRITVASNRLYVSETVPASEGSVRIFNVSNPAAPLPVGRYDARSFSTQGSAVALSGNYAFLAPGKNGFEALDVSDPGNPRRVSRLATDPAIGGVTVAGKYAYAGAPSGLQTLDMTNPASPQLVSEVETSGLSGGIVLSGNHLYLADGYEGLQVFSIAELANPRRVGSYKDGNFLGAVTVAGNHAYIFSVGGGLKILDISDPANPRVAASYQTGSPVRNVAVSGNHAFFTLFGGYLEVANISDPTHPSHVAAIQLPGHGRAMALAGQYLYIGAGVSGTVAYDISSPENPVQVWADENGDGVTAIKISGDRAYVGGIASLRVFDLANPANPKLIANLNRGRVHDLALSESHIYLTGGEGLRILELVAQPQLDIRNLSGEVEISWPIRHSGFKLQNSSLNAGSEWTDVTAAPAQNETQYSVRLTGSLDTEGKFFRLIKP